VEILSGALAINSSQFLFVIPSFTMLIPSTGPMVTPEIAFYKNQKEDAIGKFAMFAYLRNSGEYIQTEGPVSEYSHFHRYKVMGSRGEKPIFHS
jgi:hypothetical protein